MALGRPKVALILRDDERARLDSLAHRSRTAPHVARRARISDEHIEQVIVRTLEETPRGETHLEQPRHGESERPRPEDDGPADLARIRPPAAPERDVQAVDGSAC